MRFGHWSFSMYTGHGAPELSLIVSPMYAIELTIRHRANTQANGSSDLAHSAPCRKWHFCSPNSIFATFDKLDPNAAKQLTSRIANHRAAKKRKHRDPRVFWRFCSDTRFQNSLTACRRMVAQRDCRFCRLCRRPGAFVPGLPAALARLRPVEPVLLLSSPPKRRI